ncbi:Uncharacterized protein Adt_23759 [Abeliophyllum distichum]|uniref:Uncharacterized protein n=1 Tax=Abeliophyllum distichum TaxID=126358 RepID=A0ABD1SDE7_9LAMI
MFSISNPSDDIDCDNDQVMDIIKYAYPYTSHHHEQNVLEEDDVFLDDDTLGDNLMSNMSEPRNISLGLATDGFNPFGDMNKPFSMWLVVVVLHNLPPWMCMKMEFTMLTLLIPSEHEPSKDIDVYLRPLIDEIKDLWEIGLYTYDKGTNSTFNLHVAVLWTIIDLPIYGNLFGWSTNGYNACPGCNDDGTSK